MLSILFFSIEYTQNCHMQIRNESSATENCVRQIDTVYLIIYQSALSTNVLWQTQAHPVACSHFERFNSNSVNFTNVMN